VTAPLIRQAGLFKAWVIAPRLLVMGLLACATAAAQKPDPPAPEASALRPEQGMILLDYQVLRVAGDKPIDLVGFHVHNKVAEWLYVGAGLYAPVLTSGNSRSAPTCRA